MLTIVKLLNALSNFYILIARQLLTKFYIVNASRKEAQHYLDKS